MADDGGSDQTMIAVEVNGETHEVPLPEGFVSQADVAKTYMRKDTFTSEMSRRAPSIAREQGMVKPEELLTNDEFIAKVIETKGLVPKDQQVKDGDKPTGPTPEQIATMQEDWRTKELVPVQTKVQEGETRIQGLLTRMLASEIVQAAALAGVKERFLKPAADGQDQPIVSMLGRLFRFDGEHNRHFVAKGDDQFEITSDPKSTVPYKTPAEYIASWAGLPENKDLVDVEKQTGAGVKAPAGTKLSGKDVVLTREQAEDYTQLMAARETADKQGGRVVVEGTPTYGAAAAAGGV